MTGLEDARRMAAKNSCVFRDYDTEQWMCVYCPTSVPFESDEEFIHGFDCPWLSMPKIVAALEAAERLIVTAWERPADTLDGRYLVDANEISALETALQSVRVVTRVIAP